MYLFRVERTNGRGPYDSRYMTARQKDILRPMWEEHNDSNHRPSPTEDPRLRRVFESKSTNIFGFRTLDSLHRWFIERDKARLREIGTKVKFQISKYRVNSSKVILGCYGQVVFKKNEAELVEVLTL